MWVATVRVCYVSNVDGIRCQNAPCMGRSFGWDGWIVDRRERVGQCVVYTTGTPSINTATRCAINEHIFCCCPQYVYEATALSVDPGLSSNYIDFNYLIALLCVWLCVWYIQTLYALAFVVGFFSVRNWAPCNVAPLTECPAQSSSFLFFSLCSPRSRFAIAKTINKFIINGKMQIFHVKVEHRWLRQDLSYTEHRSMQMTQKETECGAELRKNFDDDHTCWLS